MGDTNKPRKCFNNLRGKAVRRPKSWEKFQVQTSRTIRPDAYRQQLHRARERFAQLLVEEVSQTLARFDRDELEIELADLGFLPFVEEFLPKG